jgi:hypothetical protein
MKDSSAGNSFQDVNIEELIRQNNGEDIDIEFHCNGRRIELNTSVYELVEENKAEKAKQKEQLVFGGLPPKLKKGEEPDPKNPASIFRSLMATLGKEDRDRDRELVGGSAHHLTIYFTIKDKLRMQKTRKDSLLELAQKRTRTHSQTVDFVSAQSLNYVVQRLLDNEFAVFKDFEPISKQGASPRKGKKPTSPTALQIEKKVELGQGKDRALVEQALKILKVLHYIYMNVHLFTNEGITFLLLKSSSEEDLEGLKFEDSEMNFALKTEVKAHMFHHSKLDANMLKSIQDPYKLVSRGLSDILKQIFQSCSFLFPFDTKVLYFKLVSFIGIDINRSLYFLKNYMSRKGALGKRGGGGPTLNPYLFGEREEKQQRIGHQKVKLDREDLLNAAI